MNHRFTRLPATGFAHDWMQKIRTDEAIRELKTDPYAPESLRGTLPLMNQPAFYEAFNVKPGDGMYLPPDQRVSLW